MGGVLYDVSGWKGSGWKGDLFSTVFFEQNNIQKHKICSPVQQFSFPNSLKSRNISFRKNRCMIFHAFFGVKTWCFFKMVH